MNISSDSTVVLSFLSTQLSEGTHNLSLSLDGPDDSDTSDNSITLSFEVEPPPLPTIVLSLARESEPVAGLQMEWTLDAYNSGVSTFDGKLICSHEGEEVFSTNTTIAIGESKNFTVSMTSKPGELVCTTSDARTSVTVNATDLLSMESAIFVGAGYSTPTLLGGLGILEMKSRFRCLFVMREIHREAQICESKSQEKYKTVHQLPWSKVKQAKLVTNFRSHLREITL